MAQYTQDTRTAQEIEISNLDAKIIEMAREILETEEIDLEISLDG